jgi:hypothetical protein
MMQFTQVTGSLDRAGLRSLRYRVIVAQLASLLLVAVWASIASFCSFLPLVYWAGLVVKLSQQRKSLIPNPVRTVTIWLSLCLILASGLGIALLPTIAFHQMHFLGELGILMPFLAGLPACILLAFNISGPRHHVRNALLSGFEFSVGLLMPVVCSVLFIFASQLVTAMSSDTLSSDAMAPMWQYLLQGISYVLIFDGLHRVIASYELQEETASMLQICPN